MKQNKKANVSVTILTLFTLIIVLFTLFSFYSNSEKQKTEILGVSVLEKAVYQKNNLDFYLNELSEDALVKTYYDFANSGKYALKDKNGIYVVGKLDDKINEKFLESFRANLISSISNSNFDDADFNNLKNTITKNLFSAEITGESIRVSMKDFNLAKISSSNLEVSYKTDLVSELNFHDFGIHYFPELKDFADCKVKAGDCDGILFNFAVETNKIGDDLVIKLTSKKEFFIDGKFQKIQFSFIAE
jgi:hypothetical protein